MNKGVDRAPEVMGIKGMNYLFMLAAGAVGGLIVTMILIVILRVNSTFLFVGYLVLVVVWYFKLVNESRIHGERGKSKEQARSRRPRVVLIHTSEAYRSLRKSK